MTIESSVINVSRPFNEGSFARTAVKVLKKGTTAGTALIASYGLSNIPYTSHFIEKTYEVTKNYFEGVIQLSNGIEIDLLPEINKGTETNHHLSAESGISYNVATGNGDIIKWIDLSKEAVDLKLTHPEIFRYENTIDSEMVNGGILEMSPLDFGEISGDFNLDGSKLYRSEKAVSTELIVAGDLPLSPIDWD